MLVVSHFREQPLWSAWIYVTSTVLQQQHGFMAEIQYENYSYESWNIIHFSAVLQHAQFSPDARIFFAKTFSEHTASVCCLCAEFILCAAYVVRWQPHIWTHFLLADQIYTSQLARWGAAGTVYSLGKPQSSNVQICNSIINDRNDFPCLRGKLLKSVFFKLTEVQLWHSHALIVTSSTNNYRSHSLQDPSATSWPNQSTCKSFVGKKRLTELKLVN